MGGGALLFRGPVQEHNGTVVRPGTTSGPRTAAARRSRQRGAGTWGTHAKNKVADRIMPFEACNA